MRTFFARIIHNVSQSYEQSRGWLYRAMYWVLDLLRCNYSPVRNTIYFSTVVGAGALLFMAPLTFVGVAIVPVIVSLGQAIFGHKIQTATAV